MSTRRFLLVCGLLAQTCASLRAAPWVPDPSLDHPELRRKLYDLGRSYCDGDFDPQASLVGSAPTWAPDGKMIPNTRSHSIRESLAYAYGLLLTGDAADRARAEAILHRVLTAQDVRPSSPTKGVFTWYAEENWETLKNADLNAAAFMGMTLFSIIDLDRTHPALDPKLRQQLEDAARLSVEAILRRNVDPGYTNIALLSSATAAAGQKLLGMKEAGAFADAKIDAVMKLAGDSLFYEYSCPTYLGVDIGAAYALKKYAFSDAFAAKAEKVIDSVWKQVAACYHAPTYQLAGPFGRAYGEDMLNYSAGLKYPLSFALGGDYPLPVVVEREHAWDQVGLMGVATLPITARAEFKQTPPAWQEFNVAGPSDGAHPNRHLSQYRKGNFVLGTVAFQDEWKQKRNLVAYWRNDGPPPTGVRVGFCLDESNETLPDGTPYGGIHFYSQQKEDAALVAIVDPGALPKAGGLSLVFNDSAMSTPGKGPADPMTVRDGTMTAYIYPVSPNAPAVKTEVATHRLHVNRPWDSADEMGSLHVLSYLIVFRPSDQPAPAVSGLKLQATHQGASVAAQVDKDNFSLEFQN